MVFQFASRSNVFFQQRALGTVLRPRRGAPVPESGRLKNEAVNLFSKDLKYLRRGKYG